MKRMQETKSSAERVRRRRQKLRAAGLRPVQLWVADTRAHGFVEECARQSRLIRHAESGDMPGEAEAWFEASDRDGWTA